MTLFLHQIILTTSKFKNIFPKVASKRNFNWWYLTKYRHFTVLAGNPSVPTESTDDHCNKTVDIYVDVASPQVTYLNRHRPLTCWYRFKSIKGIPKDWVLRLTFKKFKVGTLINSTHCEGGYLQVSIIKRQKLRARDNSLIYISINLNCEFNLRTKQTTQTREQLSIKI